MFDILLTAVLSTVLGAGVIVAIVKYGGAPKKEKLQELCVDQVLKEADQALAFDPLKDAKNKPAAVKSLLAVLLAIREKKAEQELIEEEYQRVHGTCMVGSKAYMKFEESRRKKIPPQTYIEPDLLSGVVGPDHPHYQFTEAGRREAAQRADQQNMQSTGLDAYINSPRYDGFPEPPYQAIGAYALDSLDQKNNAIAQLAAAGAMALMSNKMWHKKR